MPIRSAIAACAVLLAFHAVAQPTFTYQGRVSDNGQPANGVYDIQVRVFDADSLGNTLLTRTFNDLSVTNGLFTLELPTEEPVDVPIFTGEPRWIGVGFRPGASSVFDPFTFVARQRVTKVPEASHAEVADALVDPIWERNDFFDSAIWGDGDSRVGINEIPGAADATLLVHKQTAGEHGVRVSTSDPEGSPFLDLLAGLGDPMVSRMKLLYEGTQGVLSFEHTSGELMRLSPDDGLELPNDNVKANGFEYNSMQNRRLSISSTEWRPQNNVNYRVFSLTRGGRSYISGPITGDESMFMPISLPDGAVIDSIDLRFAFEFFAGFDATVWRIGHNGNGLNAIATGSAVTLDPSPLVMTADPALAIVDNGVFQYCIEVTSDDWDSNPTVSVGSVIVRYRVGEAD